MNKQEKVNFVIEQLEALYPEIPVPLDHTDPYTLLIAVLMSAQSTDVRVNKITPLLFERADNPYDMIRLSVDEIREIIKNNSNGLITPAKENNFKLAFENIRQNTAKQKEFRQQAFKTISDSYSLEEYAKKEYSEFKKLIRN